MAALRQNSRISLAYANLQEIPQNITDQYGAYIEEIDLTNNRISYPFKIQSWQIKGFKQSGSTISSKYLDTLTSSDL